MRTISLVFVLSALFLLAGEYDINVLGIGQAQKVLSIKLAGTDLANLGGHTEWLRLYDRDGNVVPWALQRHYTADYARTIVKYPLKLTEVRHQEDGSLTLNCEIDTDEPVPDKVIMAFNTSMKDFEQIVSIVGEGESAGFLVKDGFIFDSTSNIKLKNTELEFSRQEYRRFRITLRYASIEWVNVLRTATREWSNFGGGLLRENREVLQKAFKIDSLELFSEELVQSGTIPAWERVDCKFEKDPRNNLDGKRSYLLEVPAYPASGVYFHCKEENYSRKIRIFHVNADGKERLLADRHISHVNLGKLIDETFIPFDNAVDSGKLRVECSNGDNPSLTFLAMQARIPAYRLRLLANASMMPLKLTSIAGAKAPSYDTSALLALGESEPEGDSIVQLKDFHGETPREIKRNVGIPRYVLFLALGAAVLVMGFAIFSTAKRI